MAFPIVPSIMVVVGVLMYALATNPKVVEIGRLIAMAGLFGFAFSFGAHVFPLATH